MFDFVIELGDSHNGDAERARRLVREAARAGAKGVLLDASRLEDVFAPEVLRVSPAHRRRRLLELPRHEIGPLCAFARTQGLRIGLRPAAMDDVPFAAGLADFLAVGPHEAAWLDLVLHCAETELPLTVGTAMTDASEVWNLIQTALEAGCRDLTLLHGIMRRPTPPEACNLAAIGTLRELLDREFGPLFPDAELKVGWADRTVHPGVVARALHHWGADTVTLHLDLEGQGEGYGAGHCWLPDRVAAVIGGGYLPVPRACDGRGRVAPDPGEMDDRAWRADPADGLRPTRGQRASWPRRQPESRRTGPDVYLVADGPGGEAVHRGIALAEVLRDDHDADIVFLIPAGGSGARRLARHGFNAVEFDELDDVPTQVGFMNGLSEADTPPLCLLDVSLPAGPLVGPLQALGAFVAVVGQTGVTGADLVIVPEYGFRPPTAGDGAGRIVGGSEFLPIGPDVVHRRLHQEPAGAGGSPRVVVHMGAGDPHALVLRVTGALHDAMRHGHVQVVVPTTTIRADVAVGILESRYEEFEVIVGDEDLAAVLARADLVVTQPGPTVADALCLGIPALVLSNGPAEQPQVDRLVGSGAVRHLGCQGDLDDPALAERVRSALGDAEALSRLRFHAQELAAAPVDGHGAARLADRLVSLLRERA